MKGYLGRVLATIVLTSTLAFSGTSAWAAATVATLNGTYRQMTNGSAFWKETVGGVRIYDNLYADVGTITFDGSGNYTIAMKDQLVFAEIHYSKVEKPKGMSITFVTTAKTNEEARRLLQLIGLPFRTN